MNKKKWNIPSLLVICWMVVFVGSPLIYVLCISFLSRGPLGNIVIEFTLLNYSRILDPIYLNIFLNSLLIAFFTAFITLIVGYPFAYFAARLKKQAKYTVLLFIMIPFWTSSLLRVYGWIGLLQYKGIFNTVLLALGIIKEPIGFMYNYGAVLAGTVYMLLPFMILPVFNSVDKLDKSLLEASHDLGASRVKTFFNITLPLTAPGIAGGVTLVFIPAVGLFFISDLLGGAKTMLLGNLIQNQVKMTRNKPFGAALSVLMTLFVILFTVIYRKLSNRANSGKDDNAAGWGLF